MAYSASSGIQGGGSAIFSQLQMQQAERTADQAEQSARSLRARSDAAQRKADRAQDEARTLKVQSSEAQATADSARRGLASLDASQQTQSRLEDIYIRTFVPGSDTTTEGASTSTVVTAAATPSSTGTYVDTTA